MVSVIDFPYKFCCIGVAFKSDEFIDNVVLAEKFLGTQTIGTVFCGIHYDLRWLEGVVIGHFFLLID